MEITTRLLPYLQTFWSPVAVVIVSRGAPEVGLDSESVVEILGSVHFVGSYQPAFFVEYEVDF